MCVWEGGGYNYTFDSGGETHSKVYCVGGGEIGGPVWKIRGDMLYEQMWNGRLKNAYTRVTKAQWKMSRRGAEPQESVCLWCSRCVRHERFGFGVSSPKAYGRALVCRKCGHRTFKVKPQSKFLPTMYFSLHVIGEPWRKGCL